MAEETRRWLDRLTPLGLLRAGALLAVGLSLVFPVGGLYGLDICLFHRWTGVPCPGCGMTRAFCAIGHGRFALAWALHPFSFPLYGSAVLFLVEPMAPRGFRTLKQPGPQRILGYLATGFMAALGCFGIARMVGYYPWP